MGQPNTGDAVLQIDEYIVYDEATLRIETSQQQEEKKIKNDSLSSGERNGKSPNQSQDWGCRTARWDLNDQSNGIERPAKEGASPVDESCEDPSGILSTARHVKPCRNLPGPPGKAKYSLVTDSEPVP